MKVLVTGGAGFIGANLCRALARRPEVDRVIALDDLSTGYAANLDGLDIDLQIGSILDRRLLDRITTGADAVVHLAARPSVPKSLQDPIATHEVNATGTLYVLESARCTDAHVVVASSSSVYGDTAILPKHEELPTRPLSPYGVSKLTTEAYAAAYGSSFGLPTLAFRFFNVYGPLQAAGHDYAAVVPAFLDAALNGQPVTIHGDGQQTRDFTFVGSVVDVLVDAVLRRVTAADPVNLAFGTRASLLDLVAVIEHVLGHRVSVNHSSPRPGDIRDSQASSQSLSSLFPKALPTDLSAGIAETANWMRSHLLRSDQPT